MGAAGMRLCILGAGNCNDLDFEALSAWYSEITLVDLDLEAVTRAVERRSALRDLHALDAAQACWRTKCKRPVDDDRPLLFQRAPKLAAAILGQRFRLFRGLGGRRGMLVHVFIQALFEGPNAFAQALAHAGKTTWSEQQQDND